MSNMVGIIDFDYRVLVLLVLVLVLVLMYLLLLVLLLVLLVRVFSWISARRRPKWKKKTKPAPENPPNGKKRRSSPNTSTSTSTSTSPDKKRFSFFLSSASPRTNTPHYHRRSPIADRQKKVMARTKQTNRRQQPPSQFGGKQPRTNPAASPPPPPPQKLHECLAIIEQKTEPHYKAVACIDNKNIRVPEKELCKSVEATIDRVIQSCWTDYFISDSDVYFTVVILCYWHVRADRADRLEIASSH